MRCCRHRVAFPLVVVVVVTLAYTWGQTMTESDRQAFNAAMEHGENDVPDDSSENETPNDPEFDRSRRLSR